MSIMMIGTAKMEVKNEEIQTSDDFTAAPENTSSDVVQSTDNLSSELAQPIWSVVTYEEVAVSSLNYDDAVKWVEKLKAQQISGLCIVTDEAAGRISN